MRLTPASSARLSVSTVRSALNGQSASLSSGDAAATRRKPWGFILEFYQPLLAKQIPRRAVEDDEADNRKGDQATELAGGGGDCLARLRSSPALAPVFEPDNRE